MLYVNVSDIINELCVARQDDSRQEALRYFILSKQVLRDLKVKFLNEPKRVYLAINKSTNTVRIPFDYSRLRTLSVIEDCKDRFGNVNEKVIPLSINPYINITPQEAITCDNDCACEINHPVCQELSSYELIEENIVLNSENIGTRQTVLRVCDNGDIIKEVSEPVQKWVNGDMQCDYAIEIANGLETICSYEFDFSTLVFIYPISITMTLNGETLINANVANNAELDSFFSIHGWTKVGTQHYTITDTTDIWGTDVIIIDNGTFPHVTYNLTLERTCVETTDIQFPFYITSYKLNGLDVTPSPAISIVYQSDLDDFFDGFGFTKVDDTHYTISGTTDVWFNVVIEIDASPFEEITINFTQTNCETPLVNDGYENQLFSDVLCNVTLKDCGCISEDFATISTIVSCCSTFLQCCQNGQLTDYAGWNYVPSCCPTNSEQPYNRFGTWNIDTKNFLIYLDSVNASKILLTYDSDGTCSGDFALPDYTVPAFKSGLAWLHSQYNEEFTTLRRKELEINYKKEINDLQKNYTDVIRLSDLINALKTRKYPF